MKGMHQSRTKHTASKYIERTVRQPSTLLDFLMNNALYGISRNKAKDILKGGGVAVDGTTVTQFNLPLQPGMVVRISKHKNQKGLVNPNVKIVYEDRALVVVEKESGILSMQVGVRHYSVKQVLDEYFTRRKLKCTAHLVHRLDRDTSGLMIYAKDMEVQRTIVDNWESIVTDRRYVAVVCGKVEQDGGTVASWLKENKSYVTYSSNVDNGGKYAVTHFHTLERSNRYSLIELRLETGRKNQIRVHMSDLGHPVAGDRKYGNGDDPISRLALHAFRLNFFHPVTGEPMRFETPFPSSFTRLFDKKASAEGMHKDEATSESFVQQSD